MRKNKFYIGKRIKVEIIINHILTIIPISIIRPILLA